MTRAKYIDLDLMKENFEIIDGELWRKDSRVNKPLTPNGKTFILNVDGTKDVYQTSRVTYAMVNNVSEFEYLGLNDDGYLVPLPADLISLVGHTDADKVWLHKDHSRGYTARLTDMDGIRLSKTFMGYDDAILWQRGQVEKIWGDRLREFNVHARYFDSEPTNRQDNGSMPAPKARATFRRTYWNDPEELQMLKEMYRDETPLDDIIVGLNDAFGNNRKYGSVQSKIHKLNVAGAM